MIAKRSRKNDYGKAIWLICMVVLLWLNLMTYAYGEIGYGSWYSIESCKREGTWQRYGGRMANGEIFDDKELTCASWDYSFGTCLMVTNTITGRSVLVKVTDRGPNKRLYKKGRIIDLSKGAFGRIASLKQGLIKVEVRRVD